MTDAKGIVFKVAIVGEAAVGKTSLIKRFVYHQFEDKYMRTLGTNIYKKKIEPMGPDYKEVALQIWDVLGQKRFQSILKVAYRGTNGIIFVCDVTRRETMENLETWVSYAYDYSPNASFIFLANKNDLGEKTFSEDEMGAYSYAFNSPFYFTSAKTGESVEDAFVALTRAIIEDRKPPSREEVNLRVEKLKIDPNIRAEDRIITEFCETAGGFDVAMPVVQEQFRKLDVNFTNPTKEELSLVIQNLVTYLEYIKDKESAEKMEKDLKGILEEEGQE
jgi:small GTP-binding protein